MLLFRESIRGFSISFCIITTYSSIISLEPPFDKKKSFLTKPQKKSPKNLHKSKPSANPSQTRGKHHNAKIQHSESAIHGFSRLLTFSH